MNWKDVWRYVLTISGVLFVIATGRLQKLQWLVGRQDSLIKVCFFYFVRLISLGHLYWHNILLITELHNSTDHIILCT